MPTSKLTAVFHNTHAVLPVIHVRDQAQTLSNAYIARDAGADGVFLINHDVSVAALLDIHAVVAERFPRWFVGVNLLGLPPRECFARLSPAVAGLWVDDAGIDERASVQTDAAAVDRAREASGWTGLYFGGAPIEHRGAGDAVGAAAVAARDHMDVVTTTGPSAGRTDSIDAIDAVGAIDAIDALRAMKAAVDGFPLAVAGGITPENARDYLPYADCVLAATGISRSFHDLDPRRVARLVAEVRAHDGQSRRLTRSSYGLASERGEARGGHRVVLVDISRGPVFELDLDGFSEPAPTFAYCDDVGSRVDQLEGLDEVGTLEVEGDRYMWLAGVRRCRLLRPRAGVDGGLVRFRSRGLGEFCLEIHHVVREGEVRLLWRDDFCLK